MDEDTFCVQNLSNSSWVRCIHELRLWIEDPSIEASLVIVGQPRGSGARRGSGHAPDAGHPCPMQDTPAAQTTYLTHVSYVPSPVVGESTFHTSTPFSQADILPS